MHGKFGLVILDKSRTTKNLNLDIWKNHTHITAITLYGKEEAKLNRKMGHYICHADSYELCNLYANKFRED